MAQLYDAYEKRLYNYCHRITGNREDAADATQEAFCNVIQRLPGLDTNTLNLGAYLFTAARNACLDLIKQSKRTQPTDEIPEDRFATIPLELDPERVVLTNEQQRLARDANSRLPEKQRTVLALREVAELSYDDIASTMEMNSNAVAQLISRARLNFFKQLRDASVVLPPLDETGRRAIELAAARQDGRIADDELSWLEQHLLENEASRVNVEAMHESTKLYRAIGPLAVVALLRNTVLARASELTGGGADGADPSGRGGRNATRTQRTLALATVIGAAIALSLAVVSGLGDDSSVTQSSVSEKTIPEAPPKRKSGQKKPRRGGSGENSRTAASAYAGGGSPAPGAEDEPAGDSDRVKDLGEKDEGADDRQTTDPEPPPAPPDPPAEPPAPPTQPTDKPPYQPDPPNDRACLKQPCYPPPQIP